MSVLPRRSRHEALPACLQRAFHLVRQRRANTQPAPASLAELLTRPAESSSPAAPTAPHLLQDHPLLVRVRQHLRQVRRHELPLTPELYEQDVLDLGRLVRALAVLLERAQLDPTRLGDL